MMKKYRIGIDPGISKTNPGAIAIISDDNIILLNLPICDQPWSAFKKDKKGNLKRTKMINTKKLYNILSFYSENTISINIETVNSFPYQGISSAWKFSGAFYSTLTIINQIFEPELISYIFPTMWKKKFNFIGESKDKPRETLLEMYPWLYENLKFKKNQGRADAFFIAIYED